MAAERLTPDKVGGLVDGCDTFLFDCDGVVWSDTVIIEGVPEAITSLRKRGKRVLFVSNNSSKSQAEYVAKMAKLGIEAESGEIFGTAYATAHYLSKHRRGKVYAVCGEPLRVELAARGIDCIGVGPDPVDDDGANALSPQLIKVPLDPEVGTVCVGYDPHLNVIKLTKAINYLQDPECLFVGTNTDRALPNPSKRLVAGTGCFIEFVASTANREPTYIGKPFSPIFDCIAEECAQSGKPLDPSRTCMVGDNLTTDIVFGNRNGMRTLLVLTGYSKEGQLESLAEGNEQRPTYFADSAAVLSHT